MVEVYVHFYLYWMSEGRVPHMPTVFCGLSFHNEELQLFIAHTPSADHIYVMQTPEREFDRPSLMVVF